MNFSKLEQALLNNDISDEQFKLLLQKRDKGKEILLALLETAVSACTSSRVEILIKIVKQSGLLSIEDQSHHKRRPLFEQATRNKNHYGVIKCLLENGYHLKHDNSSMISAFT